MHLAVWTKAVRETRNFILMVRAFVQVRADFRAIFQAAADL